MLVVLLAVALATNQQQLLLSYAWPSLRTLLSFFSLRPKGVQDGPRSTAQTSTGRGKIEAYMYVQQYYGGP